MSEWQTPLVIIIVVLAVAVALGIIMPHLGFNIPQGYP